MTFPAILFSTDYVASAAAGFAVALILSYKKKDLLIVALAACGAAFLVERVMALL